MRRSYSSNRPIPQTIAIQYEISVQALPGGNVPVSFSNAGLFHETDSNGNLISMIRTDPVGYSEWRASLYEPSSDVRTW